MATDTYTASLRLMKQGAGNNNNSWGDNLNAQVIDRIEAAIGGKLDIDLSSGNVTLTLDQCLNNWIVFTGSLSADVTVTIPAMFKSWVFWNLANGGSVILTGTAGSTLQLPAQKLTRVLTNGGQVFREDLPHVGEMFFHAGSSVPAGAIKCNNALLKRASFPDLFSIVGTTWGSTDSTNFRVPPGDDTGRYLRAATGSVTVGTLQANQNKSHTHTGSGTTNTESVVHQHTFTGTTGGMNSANPHSHGISGGVYGGTNPAGIGGSGGLGGFVASASAIATTGTDINHAHSFSGTTDTQNAFHTHNYSFTTSTGSADGAEARPESIVGLLCIRY